jgi:hypothetical protein
MSLKYILAESGSSYSSVCNGIRSVKWNFLPRHAYHKHTFKNLPLSKTTSNFSIYVDSIESAKCKFDV